MYSALDFSGSELDGTTVGAQKHCPVEDNSDFSYRARWARIAVT